MDRGTKRMAQAGRRRQGRSWRMTALGILTLVSALATVILSYQNRILYRSWQAELRQTEALEVEWRQLLLEESAWLGHARIEKLARNPLDMILPRGDRIVPLRMQPEVQ